MSAELSGFVSGLSGRVDSLNNLYSYLNQQLLSNADLDDFNIFKITWNNQFQQLTNTQATMSFQLQIIQNLLTNLTMNVANNLTLFRTHTGLPAVSGHSGL